MAITVTKDSRFNANWELGSGYARGLNFCSGYIDATYSASGGLTWTAPFPRTIYVGIAPQDQYFFTYNVTTTMFRAYQCVVTTTALASTLIEVASDTDLTTTSLSDHIRFVAFGF